MMQWNYIVTIACLLLLAFLAWKEIKRQNRSRLYARLLASVIAVISLAYLLLPFPLRIRQQAAVNKKASLPATNVPAGIQAIYWPQKINAGETLRLQGRFHNKATTAVKLLLSGFNERLDSVMIPAHQQQSFELSTRPRHIGRALYTLTALAKDTIEKEGIPVEVLPGRPLKILMLAAAPDFENKFLANWLSQNGSVVAMRTAISKNKYSYTFLDTARFQLERISPALLSAFDVLISDARALASLNKQELAGIRAQVAEKGLGLIIKADSSASSRNFYDRPFPLNAVADKNEQPVSVQTAGSGTAATLVMEPLYIHAAPGTQALVWDNRQHILVSSSLYGSGKLVLTTLHNTYTWVLSGRQEPYQAIWSLLLQKAARPQPLALQWRIGAALPKAHMPVPLYLETSQQPSAAVNAARLSLAQDGTLPFQWQGTYWPTHAGWQAATSLAGDTSWWYAFDEKAWQPLVPAQPGEKLKRQNRGSTAVERSTTAAIPQMYFLVIFVLAIFFLWVEEKLV